MRLTELEDKIAAFVARRALITLLIDLFREEMLRVAKPGAKIVIGDEGLAPGKEKLRLRRWLLKQRCCRLQSGA